MGGYEGKAIARIVTTNDGQMLTVVVGFASRLEGMRRIPGYHPPFLLKASDK